MYPMGSEKQIIQVLTGKEIPAGGRPADIGVLVHNVATAFAVQQAVRYGKPLISRIVTMTGHGITTPHNLEALFGTPVRDLIAQCGGTTPQLQKLVLGGPLMGIPLQNDELPIIKTTNCILAVTAEDLGQHGPERNCIRCGECARACPASLLPQQLYWHARAKDFDKAQDYNLFDCIECGCCAYVCPSNLPLVHYYRFAKTTIWAQERDRKASDQARERHDFREFRQEREKAERAEKLARKKAALEGGEGDAGGDEAKKAAIKAAMERAKARREGSEANSAGAEGAAPEQPKES
jgi:electron transport complex protein RnfC